jgi:hypothetical protein
MPSNSFDLAIVTAPRKEEARAVASALELAFRQNSDAAALRCKRITAIETPPGGVGSGGALVNAIRIASDAIHASKRWDEQHENIFSGSSVLIILAGEGLCGCQTDQYGTLCGSSSLSAVSDRIDESSKNVFTSMADAIHRVCVGGSQAAAAAGGVRTVPPAGVLVYDATACVHVASANVSDLPVPFTADITAICASTPPHTHDSDENTTRAHAASSISIHNADTEGYDIAQAGSQGTHSGFMLHLSPQLCGRILSAPLDACTYMVEDQGGGAAERFCVWHDMLTAMKKAAAATTTTATVGHEEDEDAPSNITNTINELCSGGLKSRAVALPNAVAYTCNTPSARLNAMSHILTTESHKSHHTTPRNHRTTPRNQHACVINSILSDDAQIGQGSIVENTVCCSPGATAVIGKRSLVKNLHTNGSIQVPDSTLLVQVRLKKAKTTTLNSDKTSQSCPSTVETNLDHTQHACLNLSALILIGIDDVLDAHYKHESATFLGKPWSSLLDQGIISVGELWPDESEIDPPQRCLRSAKLFPVHVVQAYKTPDTVAENLRTCSTVTDASMLITCLLNPVQHAADVAKWKQSDRISLQEALAWSDTYSELMWTRHVQDQRDAEWVEDVLLGRQTDACLMPVVRRSADLAYIAHKNSSSSITRQECVSHTRVFAALEKCASECEYDAAARALMHIAEWITAYADEVWGTRSGPGRHAEWRTALESLYAHGQAQAVQRLAEVRRAWLTTDASPLEYIRCARHYESAAQVLTRKAVESCACFIQRIHTQRTPVGEWASMQVPARIDLAGGWLDTPPICYEVSGMVINGSIKVDGELPIGAKASRTADAVIRLQVEDGEDVICSTLEDMLGCSNPSSPAALLKACTVVAGRCHHCAFVYYCHRS